MPFYETMFLTRQDLSSSQNEKLAKSLQDIIEANDGTISRTEFWGLRNLTYRINKNRKAHYILFNMDASAEAIEQMEEELRYNDNVLRYMTLRTEDLPTEASIAAQDNDRAESFADSITDDGNEEADKAEAEKEKEEEPEEKAESKDKSDASDNQEDEENNDHVEADEKEGK